MLLFSLLYTRTLPKKMTRHVFICLLITIQKQTNKGANMEANVFLIYVQYGCGVHLDKVNNLITKTLNENKFKKNKDIKSCLYLSKDLNFL